MVGRAHIDMRCQLGCQQRSDVYLICLHIFEDFLEVAPNSDAVKLEDLKWWNVVVLSRGLLLEWLVVVHDITRIGRETVVYTL